VLKEKHLKLQLKHPLTGKALEAIAFNVDIANWPNNPQKVLLAYRLDVNTFRGESRLQLMVEYLEAIS
jgi:single-stranded-DNA-specific exonuclease